MSHWESNCFILNYNIVLKLYLHINVTDCLLIKSLQLMNQHKQFEQTQSNKNQYTYVREHLQASAIVTKQK